MAMQSEIIVSVVAVAWSTILQCSRSFRERVLLRRVIAAVILFALPGIQLRASGDAANMGLYFSNPAVTLLTMLLFSAFAVAVNKSAEPDTSAYPQLKEAHWTPRLFVMNGTTWILYLLAYELLFRGYLFFLCLEHYPLWVACTINIVIYSLSHLPKGIKETFLCIPFGLLLCMLTWYTGNIWSAVFIHIALALSNEYYAVDATRRKRQLDYAFRSK
jgi:membrane protease YdiL (CAAX protease family)